MEEYAQTVPTPKREENVRSHPEAVAMIETLTRAAALDKYKCRTEGEKDQQLSGPMVAALITILTEYLLDETATTTPEPLVPGLNAGTTFVVKAAKPCDKRSEGLETWTIEDVASREVTDIDVPVALLNHNTTPDAILNTGVIPILERDTRGVGLVKYRFSLVSLPDGRKTPLYGWTWLTFPTFS